MLNRIVTKGLSVSGRNSLVTSGYGIFDVIIREIVETSRYIFKGGKKVVTQFVDEFEDIVIHAKLLSVNDNELDRPVKGWIKITYNTARKIFVKVVQSTIINVKNNCSDIVVTAKRIIKR